MLKLVQSTILKESLVETKKNGFLSGLIFMMLLKVEKKLDGEQVRRMLVLSMAAMDRMRSAMRLYLRKKLILKCKLVREAEGRRKRLIWSRREGKAKEDGKKWKEKVEGRVEKLRAKEAVKKKVMKKVGKWERNLEKEGKK